MKKLLFLLSILLIQNGIYAQPTPYDFTLLSVYEDSAVFEFKISSSCDEAGVCWSTSSKPTINDNKASVDSPVAGTHQITATGLGTQTTLNFVAYAANGLSANYSSRITIKKGIWEGDVSDSWSATGNWTNNMNPETTDIIIIPNVVGDDPVVAANSSVNKIIMNDGGSLTINNGVTLTVSDDLTIKGASGSSGIICNGTGTVSVSGTSNYERYIAADDWHLLSSPNNNSDITQLAGIYVNSWDEASASWSNLNSNSTLGVMKGYSVRYGSSAQTVTFKGSFNNGNQSINVTNFDTGDGTETYGWNLIGNPYPSPIDWDASSGWTRTGINGTVYVYDASASNYVTFNHGIETGPFWIPPTQGFYVYATSTSSTLQMTNDVRGVSSAAFYKKKNEFPNLQIAIHNNLKEDISKIYFHPEASFEFDNDYDGYKLFSWVEDIPQIYTISGSDSKQLAINTINSELLENLKESIVIKLGYKTNLEKLLSIRISHKELINEGFQYIINDKLLDIQYDITTNAYQFFSDAGEFNDRFELIINKSPNSVLELSKNQISCHTINNTLIINSKDPIRNGKILVYDMLGRPIINKSLTTKTSHVFSIPEKTNIFVVTILGNETFLFRKTLVK
jgi:hypothetical protein